MRNFYNITINENGGTIYRRKARKKSVFLYYAFQKAAGAALIAISFLPGILTGEGGEAVIFCLPIGLYTIFTKSRVLW